MERNGAVDLAMKRMHERIMSLDCLLGYWRAFYGLL